MLTPPVDPVVSSSQSADSDIVVKRVSNPPIAEIVALAARVDECDGVAGLGEQPLAALTSGSEEVTHLVATCGGRLAGYAQLAESSAELIVDPDLRRRGVGLALAQGVFHCAPAAAIWAHGNLRAAQALATSLGLVQVRELLKMRRDSAEGPAIAAPQPPQGVALTTVAEASASSAEQVFPRPDGVLGELLRVNNAAFSWHPEQGGATIEQLRERLSASWVDPSGIFLAIEAAEPARILGFHWTKIEPAPSAAPATTGEVYVVGVDPAAQGRRIGSYLTAVGVRYLEDLGLSEVVLYVEGDNSPARRTYERLGFTVVHTDVMYAQEPSASTSPQ